jgi:type IV pilus assembly protein PilC
MFESSAAELPALTRALIAVSDSAINFWYIYLAVILGAVAIVSQYKQTAAGKRFYEAICLRAPIIREPMRQIVTARFTRTLSTLLASGVDIIKALESATKTTNHSILADDMRGVIEGVKQGDSLTSQMRKVPLFPPLILSLVNVGEQSGDVDGLLGKAADFYDAELETATSRLVSILEPALILVMAVVIGSVFMAIMLPMFSMYGTVA